MTDPRYPYSDLVSSEEQRAEPMSTGSTAVPSNVPVVTEDNVPVVTEDKTTASRRGVDAACVLLFAKLILLVDKFIPWSYEFSWMYASRTQGTSIWFWLVVNVVLIALLIIYLARRVNLLRYIAAGIALVTHLVMQPWTAVALGLPWYTLYLPMDLLFYSGVDVLRLGAMWVLSLTCIVTAIRLAIPDRKRVGPADRY